MRRCSMLRCPSSSLSRASTPGMCCASHSPWAGGTIISWRPCQSCTGTEIEAELEAPRLGEGEVVVQPARPARADALAGRGDQLGGEAVVDDGDVGRAEQRAQRLHQLGRVRVEQLRSELLEQRAQLLGPLERRPELDHVVLAHAGEEVEALGAVGADAAERRGGRDPVAEQGGAGERVRPAARAAGDQDAAQPEAVCDGVDVGGHVRDRPALVAVGAAVAGTVVGDQPDAARGGVGDPVAVERREPGVP